jgi:transposase
MAWRSLARSTRSELQARDNTGFDKSAFLINGEAEVVTCPEGKQSISWLPNTYPANGAAFEARFARRDCTPCPSRSLCTKAGQEPRSIGLQTGEHHKALPSMRKRQTMDGCRKFYDARASIEGTHAQAIRRSGLRPHDIVDSPRPTCNTSLQQQP